MKYETFEEKVKYIYQNCNHYDDIYYLIKAIWDENTKDCLFKGSFMDSPSGRKVRDVLFTETVKIDPGEWLKFNYNLEIGSVLPYKGGVITILDVKATDNIGHYRTKYPVVIGIQADPPHLFINSQIEWMTIESIYGFWGSIISKLFQR